MAGVGAENVGASTNVDDDDTDNVLPGFKDVNSFSKVQDLFIYLMQTDHSVIQLLYRVVPDMIAPTLQQSAAGRIHVVFSECELVVLLTPSLSLYILPTLHDLNYLDDIVPHGRTDIDQLCLSPSHMALHNIMNKI